MDADPKEIFFSCCWTNDAYTNEPLLAVAGFKGIVRTILPFKSKIKSALFGHGSSINDLRIHPTRRNILLSASKDYTIRLWNVKNDLCVCVLGGCEGHRDEVLSADFSINGSILMSCSIDHSLKMWNLSNPKIHHAICESENFTRQNIDEKYGIVCLKKCFFFFPLKFCNVSDLVFKQQHTIFQIIPLGMCMQIILIV
jgi:polycomb protein EED